MAAYLPRRDRSANRQDRTRERRSRPADWQYSCGLCREDHALKTCRQYRDLAPRARYETVERRGYCRNCLARSHLAPDCPTIEGCRKCDKRHHTSLHNAAQLTTSVLQRVTREASFRDAVVFVPTAMVRVAEDTFETWSSMRALINQSSTVSRIASTTFRRLNLTSFRQHDRRFAIFKIKSRHTRSVWVLKVNALITDELPKRPFSDPIIEDPTENLSPATCADIDPRSNTPVDLELGADVYHAIYQEGFLNTGPGRVHAFKTTLGYVFSGPVRNT